MADLFQKVTEYNNWCHYDQLDGVDLSAGEKVIVRWPDGTEEATTVIVKRSRYEMSDMGIPCTIPEQRAYLSGMYRGVAIEIPLQGSALLLKRV